MVAQCQFAESLPAQRERPVGRPVLMHRLSRFAAQSFGNCNLRFDDVAVAFQLAKFDEVGKHRMQAVRVDELLRKIEWRTEVVDPGINVGLRIAETDDTRSGGESGIPSGGFFAIIGLSKPLDYPLESGIDQRVLVKQTRPIGIHSEVDRLVVKQLGGPLDGVDLGNLGCNH